MLETCALCSETLYSFNLRSSVIGSYEFTEDLYYIKSVRGTIPPIIPIIITDLIEIQYMGSHTNSVEQ